MLKIRYRAQHIRRSNLRYTLWIDDGTGPDEGGIKPLFPSDIIADGQEHEVVRDLRLFRPAGPLSCMALCLYGDDSGQCQLELLSMHFEVADNSEPQAYADEEIPVVVKVVDEKQRPVEGATVIADPEWRNFARQERTGADGVATIKAVALDAKHHVRIERNGYITVELTQEITLGKQVEATLLPAGRFSGQVLSPEDKPVAGVMVEASMSWRKVGWLELERSTVTDAQGRWALTLVDSAQYPFMVRFAHEDYVSARWGGQNYKVNLEEMRSGKSIVHLQR